jgi:hypothetical protein
MPVLAAAENSFVAVGAVVPAGSVYGKLTLSVASVHPDAPVSQDVVGAVPTVVEVVGSVWPPEVNVVDVAVTFQPEPDPVASPMSNSSVEVTFWFVPFNVVVGKVIVPAGVLLMNARLPALNVTEAVVAPCETDGSAAAPAPARAHITPSHVHRFLTIVIMSNSLGLPSRWLCTASSSRGTRRLIDSP